MSTIRSTVVLTTLLATLVLISVNSHANSPLPNHRHIQLKGYAEITAKPDQAKVSFEVNSIQDSALKAKQEVDGRINRLLAGIENFKVDKSGVSASKLVVEPNLTYDDDGNDVIKGHVASRDITITLKQIDQLNDLIDFALSVEINQLDDIELISSKAASLKDKVNNLAITNAKEKAESLANAFGAKLGKIYSINPNSSSYNYGYRSADVERIEVTGSRIKHADLAPGRYLQTTISFSASINVVFDLEVK
ncbi:SIMPL domain-containing protein [Shewanella sp. WXL01]|uniref:SIMPL domain-containing protein n=1 Tax=Shewanella sp. WXL01 TaxID=2709721 RepID=UPI001438567B|nr:SIMPL domain-containing protein [Shewanella sp. WXL01]NKF51013.1 SIMPL domain-containing protein [Shewanella sp. WXL01]